MLTVSDSHYILPDIESIISLLRKRLSGSHTNDDDSIHACSSAL